jgi:cytidylate kinase
MMDKTAHSNEELALPPFGGGQTPRHGYRGDLEDVPSAFPWGLTLAIRRETGARGATIAKRAALKLGWRVYSQDLLEYIAQEGTFRQDVLDHLPVTADLWVDEQLNRLLKEENLSRNPSILDLARMVLSLGAEGEVVLLGRGAGCILPARSTLHVRLVAPVADRVAYMSQWMRLTEDEAAEQVRQRDSQRADFIATHFHRKPTDLYQYDIVINTSLLGEERSAELIVHAARAKAATLAGEPLVEEHDELPHG